jgi:hypothetical protein
MNRFCNDRIRAAYYLAALIDGEGCIHLSMSGGNRIQITNTDVSILEAAEDALTLLEIPHCRRLLRSATPRENRQECWNVVITGGFDSYATLQSLVPLQCKRKQVALVNLINSYPTRIRLKPTKEHLREMYNSNKLTSVGIAKLYNISNSTACRWLKQAGITLRDKREAALLCQEKNVE